MLMYPNGITPGGNQASSTAPLVEQLCTTRRWTLIVGTGVRNYQETRWWWWWWCGCARRSWSESGAFHSFNYYDDSVSPDSVLVGGDTHFFPHLATLFFFKSITLFRLDSLWQLLSHSRSTFVTNCNIQVPITRVIILNCSIPWRMVTWRTTLSRVRMSCVLFFYFYFLWIYL